MKKQSSSSVKTWGLFGLGIILALYVVINAFWNAWPATPRMASFGIAEKGVAVMPAAMPDLGGMEPAFDAMMIAPEPMPPFRGGATLEDLEGNVPEQRIIKNGNLSLRVDDVDSALERGRQIAAARGGVVEASSVSDEGERPRSAFMVLRVPADRFDATMADLRGVAVRVLNETTNAEDVTLQFVDLEADLRNAKAEEETYLRLLDRSGDLKDVLAVTQQLAAVRQRIERLEGRKRFLENQTDLSTISVSMTEETRVAAPTRKWQPGEVLRDALRTLVLGLQGFVDFLIRAVILLVGLVLPIGLLIWLIAWAVRKTFKKWI